MGSGYATQAERYRNNSAILWLYVCCVRQSVCVSRNVAIGLGYCPVVIPANGRRMRRALGANTCVRSRQIKGVSFLNGLY